MTYRIREVDATDDDVADTIRDLHTLTFFDEAPLPDTGYGFWWLAYKDNEPVGFSGVVQSTLAPDACYLKRTGVLHEHRGHGLQKRFTRAREAKAKRVGWKRIITDTTDNPSSANNLIAAGYKTFVPDFFWGLPRAIYWVKYI